MRRTLIWILPGLVALFAQFGCQTGGNEPFSCTENDDCPPFCQCDAEEDRFFGTCVPTENAVCGGSCIDDTTCPRGTSCDLDDVLIFEGRPDLWLYACIPDSGTGGSGGAGGAGGTGGGATTVTCLTACPDPDECVEFSDNTFDVGDWEHVAVVQAAGTEYGVSQGTDEQGKPDPYRFVSHTLVPPPNVNELSISVAHGNTNAVYDPSADRAIHSLHYSYDGRALPDSRQASIRPLAKQGGKWFWTAFDSKKVLINEGGWVTREWPAVSLIGFGHAGQLDLTENGTEITFGFSTAASHKGTSPTTRNTGVDNWRVVICKE